MLKYEETEEIRYVDMGYKEEAQYLTKMCKYYIIELAKFKKKKPKVGDLLEKWLYVIGGDQKMIEECKNDNEEIKEAVDQLTEMSADEIRERSRLTYNTEMNEAKRKGLAAGLAEGRAEWRAKGLAEGLAEGRAEGKSEEKKEIAKKMKAEGLDIKLIQKITNLSEEEIKSL